MYINRRKNKYGIDSNMNTYGNEIHFSYFEKNVLTLKISSTLHMNKITLHMSELWQ